jgi:hypothetical protein
MDVYPPSARHDWMRRMPQIGTLRIDQLVLAGTHDSGSDKQAPQAMLPQEYTQDVSPAKQIEAGIRALDLRVSFVDCYAVGDPRRFQLYHLTLTGRTVSGDIFDMLEHFYNGAFEPTDTQKEIIILDFHQFEHFTDAIHDEFIGLIDEKLRHRLIRYEDQTLSINELWAHHPGRTVVAAYNKGNDHPLLWPGVDQLWSGSNLNTTKALKVFMDGTTQSRKQDYQLQAIQCAKYVLPFHVPDDFSDKVDEWFHSVDIDSYIQNFHIINTDWSLRSRIIENCIHACHVRAAAYAQHSESSASRAFAG